MSDTTNVSLSELAKSLMDQDGVSPSPVRASAAAHKEEHCAHGWWAFLFYFLIISLILYFVFFCLRPSFVLKDCGSDSHSRSSEDFEDREIDNGKLLGSAIVGALILIFVFWLLSFLANW